MDQFSVIDAACLFLGALTVLIIQTYRQQPAPGTPPLMAWLKRAAGPGPATAPGTAAPAESAIKARGPIVAYLRDQPCHDWVELANGQRYRFAGAASLLPNGQPDMRYRPVEGIILNASLYLPERSSVQSGSAG